MRGRAVDAARPKQVPALRGRMGHCPHCDTDLRELVESDTDARYAGGVTVWECASCGAILGTSGVGV